MRGKMTNNYAVQMDLGEVFKILRLRENLTLKDVAERADTSMSTVCRLENGALHVNFGTMMRVAKVLGYDLRIEFVAKEVAG